MDKYKKLAMIICSFGLMFLLTGITYSYFNYTKTSSSQQLIAGDIHFNLNEGQDEIELTNIFPESVSEARSRDDNYITFSVNGKNTSNKTIYYEFVLNYGETLSSPKSRYNDEHLRFDLVEVDVNGNEIEYLVDARNYSSIVNKRIWVDTIDANTSTEIVHYYKLRVWLDENVIISDSAPNANYTTEEYPNKYATIKLIAKGDFEEKELFPKLYNIMKNNSVLDSINSIYVQNETPGIIFTADASDNNGKGLYMLDSSKNDTYPIVYYRGAVTDNNVFFANKCWKAVRTTNTGGVILVYNGLNTGTESAPSCNNTGNATRISAKVNGTTYTATNFNTFNSSFASIGYMYGDKYTISNGSVSGAYYANGFDWNGTSYSLTEDATTTVGDGKHYSCASTNKTDTCTTIRYYFHSYYYITLTGGDGIDETLAKINTNSYNSLAKQIVDAWYVANLVDYTNKLEDTIWCNDRSFSNKAGLDPNGPESGIPYFGSYSSYQGVPSFTCSKNDSFTVDNVLGNQKLTYPIALLSANEAILAGRGSTSYLNSGIAYYTMSPSYYWNPFTYSFAITSSGIDVNQSNKGSASYRPAISIASTTNVVDGDGTVNNPYIIE